MHHPVSPCPSPSLRQRSLHLDEPVVIENWRKEKTLGSGAFGVITLWKNLRTNEFIAIKQCRYCVTPGIPNGPLLISKQQRERWKHEVDLMNRLNHPNVVKSVPVPVCLEPHVPQPLPSLGMEYCSGGDLRQVLNKPEHCCGLPERSVRLILSQISSALLYLHSERIIHRDVKPENIVLKLEANGTVTYKIIDLGYCKELDQSSMASSFVGTMQYLAPELFENKQYTAAVDNWSFGLLTHEIITGKRPFAPNSTPAQWLPIVRDKKPEAIGATLDTNSGNVTYHKTISPFNHVTCVFKCDLERWLQTVLQKDPEKRGGKEAFQMIKSSILSKQVIKVFSVPSLQLFTYELMEGMKIANLKRLIEADTRFPCKDQVLLIPSFPNVRHRSLLISGDSLDNERVTQCLTIKSHTECEGDTIYLFNRSHSLSFTQYSVTSLIPPSEESVLLNPTNLVTFQDHKSTAGNFVWVAQELIVKLNRLTCSHQALIYYCLQLNQTVKDKEASAIESVSKLSLAKVFLEQQIAISKENTQHLQESSGDIDVQSLEKELNDAITKLKGSDEVKRSLEEYSKKLNEQYLQLLRLTTKSTLANIFDPFSPKINKECDQLFMIYSTIVQAFEDIRHTSRDDRIAKAKLANSQAAFDNTQLVKLICDLFQLAEKLVRNRYSEMNNLLELSASTNATGKILRYTHSIAESQCTSLQNTHKSLLHSQWSIISPRGKCTINSSHANGSNPDPAIKMNELQEQLDKMQLQNTFSNVESTSSSSTLNTAPLLTHHE